MHGFFVVYCVNAFHCLLMSVTVHFSTTNILFFSLIFHYYLKVWLLIMRHIHNLMNTLYGRKQVDTQKAFQIKYVGIYKGFVIPLLL